MAEYETIAERIISGKGVLKVPTDARKNRLAILYLDVIREPRNKYLNKNWNPPRSRYATITFLRNDYVVGTAEMEFERQSYDGIADIAGQTLIALKCAYDGILQTFVNLSIALSFTPGGVGLTPLTKNDTIKDYENLNLMWTEARIVCYADTAVQAKLVRLQYDTCDPDKDKDKPPPPPPPPPPKVPPGTPIEGISPPYNEDDNDGGNTDPFPGDEPFPEEPEIPSCTLVDVVVREETDGAGTFTNTYRVYAPVGDARQNPTEVGGVQIFAGNRPPAECNPSGQWIQVNKYVVPVLNVTIVSVTPVE